MITEVRIPFDTCNRLGYLAYKRLRNHEFLTKRCKHHRQEILGQACIGEVRTIVRTHSGSHTIEMYDSWDGSCVWMSNPNGIDPLMLDGTLRALLDSGVTSYFVTYSGTEYEVRTFSLFWLMTLLHSVRTQVRARRV